MTPAPPITGLARITAWTSLLLGIALIGLGAVLWRPDTSPAGHQTGGGHGVTSTPIDGNRAYRYLRQQTRLGPRPTGSPAIERLRLLLERHFSARGLTVERQRFVLAHPIQGRPVQGANIVARYRPEARRRVLLAAHYDTRPLADEDRRRRPYLGANDGASGVALLMELAHHLNQLDGDLGVDLVCFDAEELVYGASAELQRGEYCLGSKHFARLYQSMRPPRYRYEAALVLDMVGGKNANFYPERYSVERAGWLVDEVWAVARELGADCFRLPARGRRWRYEVYDDHVPLLDAGIPAIDIIDFDYEHWHRTTDRPEQCSAETLGTVGTVVWHWLLRRSGRR